MECGRERSANIYGVTTVCQASFRCSTYMMLFIAQTHTVIQDERKGCIQNWDCGLLARNHQFSGYSLQQYVNRERLDVQAGFRKGRGTRDQIANIHWIIEKAWEFQKNIYFCFIDYTKAFDSVGHYKLWKILKEMGIQDRLTCLLRNPYAGQEAIVRTRHGTTDWFQIGKGVYQGYILSPC